MGSKSQSKVEANKPLESHPFVSLHLEIKKAFPYVGDIWVLALHVDYNRYVKIFILRMEQYGFKPRNRLVRIEHVGVTSRLMSWMLEIDHVRLHN
jgi:hypothetical protein